MSKLLGFQKKVGAIKKDSTNPYYNSKYVDINSLLDTIKPLLNELELIIIQPLEIKDGKNILTTKIIDGERILAESSIIIPDNPDPQKIGSAITYYRRYSLQALLLLEAEDDDANSNIPVKKKIGLKNDVTNKKTDPKYDPNILDRIKNCKTVEELKKLWSDLTELEQPIYIDKISTRKSILQAGVKNG